MGWGCWVRSGGGGWGGEAGGSGRRVVLAVGWWRLDVVVRGRLSIVCDVRVANTHASSSHSIHTHHATQRNATQRNATQRNATQYSRYVVGKYRRLELRLPPPLDLRGVCTVRCWVNMGLAVAVTGFIASIATLTLFLVPGQAEAIMERTDHAISSFFDDRMNVREGR